ncbi:hypothetical protein CO059_03125, partial [candidate division WWE3 bacterium CG_4_9_14_0_2_um_filter_48_10]
QNVSNLENSNLDIVSNLGFRISNLKTGEIVERVGAFSEAAIANLKAGKIEVQELSIGGQSLKEYLDSYFATRDSVSGTETLVDPEGEIAQINADGSVTRIIAEEVEAGTGVFQRLTVVIEAIFDHVKAQALDVAGKLTAKTAKIAEAIIQTLRVEKLSAEKAEVKTLEVEALGTKGESSGSGVIPTGEGKVVIKSLAVTEHSKIYVTFTTDYAPATRFWIAEKKVPSTDSTPSTGSGQAGSPQASSGSFTVELDAPVAADAKFDWWIVN